jgi:membrane protein implicated in regulation of membrane protease activity
MMIWIWLVIAVIAAIGETVTYDLFLASVAGAALVAAGAAIVVPWWPVQVAAFAILSLIGIFVLRPIAKAALGLDVPHDHTSVSYSSLAGKSGIVTRTVTEDGGQIRIGEGEFWSARTYDPDDTLEPGRKVRVMVVEGVTALVEPATLLPDSEVDESNQVLNERGV